MENAVRRAVALPKGKATAWRRFNEASHPRRPWFSRLQIAEDGGFGEVGKLFTWDRFFYALLAVACLVLNLHVLSVPNVQALMGEQWLTGETDSNRNLIINACVGRLTDRRFNPKVLLAILELGLLGVLLVRMLHIIGAILLSCCVLCDPSIFWHHVCRLMWCSFPELMAMSSLRLLNYVTPSVFIPALSTALARGEKQGCAGWGLLIVVRFLLLRCILGLVGLEVFMIKFDEAAKCLGGATLRQALLCSLAFLNQMLGIVQISPMLQDRLFLFLFGGEDCFREEEEWAVQHVWRAMLAKRIWEAAVDRGRGWCIVTVSWYLAVMLAYGDRDFQLLTLNERHLDSPHLGSQGTTSRAKAKNNVLMDEALVRQRLSAASGISDASGSAALGVEADLLRVAQHQAEVKEALADLRTELRQHLARHLQLGSCHDQGAARLQMPTPPGQACEEAHVVLGITESMPPCSFFPNEASAAAEHTRVLAVSKSTASSRKIHPVPDVVQPHASVADALERIRASLGSPAVLEAAAEVFSEACIDWHTPGSPEQQVPELPPPILQQQQHQQPL